MTTTDEADIAERNWAGNVTYGADTFAAPTTMEQLREVVAGAGSAKVLGSRHSFNDIADTSGTIISLAEMPREIDVTDGAVRVSAGLRYGDIASVLHDAGRALSNLASLPHISVAGAIATGTHGSGDAVRALSSAVRSLVLVTADGAVRTLDRGDPDFAGAVVSLGALGVVTHVELDTEPTFDVRQDVFDQPAWDAILDRFDAVSALGDSVSLFTTWRDADRADLLWTKRRIPAVEQDTDLIRALGAIPASGPRHPIPGANADATSAQQGVAGPWFERLPHFRLAFTPSVGAELQSEYLIPREHAPAAIDALRGIAGTMAPLVHTCEVRTVARDDLWLSPAYERDSVGLHFTWHRQEAAVRALLPTIEARLEPFAARPHWGKVFEMPGKRIRDLYSRWGAFADLRARFDPRGVFDNAYLARLGN